MENDLISRAALMGVPNVRKVCEYDETGCSITYKAVPVEVIEKAPSVKAEPVRHGRWVDKSMDYYCSVCGKHFHDDMFWIQGDCIEPNYCPNCGAKMDAKEND